MTDQPPSVRSVLQEQNVSIYIYLQNPESNDIVLFLRNPRITFLDRTIIITDGSGIPQFVYLKRDVKQFNATRIGD